MKTPNDHEPDLFARFPTDEAARLHLESIRWKDGIVCPHCECRDQAKFSAIKANPETKVREGLRWCAACKRQFTVTLGTVFESSHIPLRKWLIAWYLVCSSKKGISSLQLQRNLKLGSYRTALFMTHRIRYALQQPVFDTKLSGTIEADEAFMGGKATGKGKGSRTGKTVVLAMIQRGGEVRSQVLPAVTANNLKQAIRDNVEICSEVHTDHSPLYVGIQPKYDLHSVKHKVNEFTRKEKNRVVTVNTVECFFSLLKRGITGTFHHVGAHRLPLYLAEFDHRFTHRFATDDDRTIAGIRRAEGKRMIYKTAKKKDERK